MSDLIVLPQFVRALLGSPPHRGEGLNVWLFRVARVLHPFLGHDEIVSLLEAATCGESIKPGEIARAVERSKSCAWIPGQSRGVHVHVSPWPQVNAGARDAITRIGGGLIDLQETSPVRIDDGEAHTEDFIDALFPGNPLLCCGFSKSEFDTGPREEWRGHLASLAVIVPSPMTARSGLTQDGKESAHAKSITGERRYLVVEQDKGALDEQAAVLLHLADRVPLALAVHSGGKSIHGWFNCIGQSEEKLLQFFRYAVSLGADRQLWCRSQFVRMPDGTRENGRRQPVYFFNPETIKI